MRLICFWCFVVAAVRGQSDFYGPQTFKNNVNHGAFFETTNRPWSTPSKANDVPQSSLFTPASRDETTRNTNTFWNGNPKNRDNWRGFFAGEHAQEQPPTTHYTSPPIYTKEQRATIIHHKQALTSEGSFRFEYASDNGLAAGETIEPDGTRVGAYQYKDPTGQIVKLKYRAGKEGFQILEGTHVPKSTVPVPPPTTDAHHQAAYEKQREQFELQQKYNQQQPQWNNKEGERASRAEGGHNMYVQELWRPDPNEDDGQYRENVNQLDNRGPHTFGEGYSFAFNG